VPGAEVGIEWVWRQHWNYRGLSAYCRVIVGESGVQADRTKTIRKGANTLTIEPNLEALVLV